MMLRLSSLIGPKPAATLWVGTRCVTPQADAGRGGWCRLMGLTAITLFLTTLYAVRNQRIVDAFDNRQTDDARRAAAGLPARPRRRRRRTLDDLLDTA